jgi:general stress protein 26
VLAVLAVASIADAMQQDLYRSEGEDEILGAARTIIHKDPQAALVTLDAQGQPRVRTVDVRPPDDDMVIWVATRPDTRKVAQIRGNPKVTLYFEIDEESSYATVMGTATLHDDLATKEAKKWRQPKRRELLWPDYPTDYLLIRIEPRWIEVLGEGIDPHPETWRPQAVVFDHP